MRHKSRLPVALARIAAVAAAVALAAFIGLAATRGERQVATAPTTSSTDTTLFGGPAVGELAELSEACTEALTPVQDRISADPDAGTELNAEQVREFRSLVDTTYLACDGNEIQFIERDVVAPWLNGR